MGQLAPRYCKACKITHLARYSHTSKSNNMIYADEKLRQWKGAVCPDCQTLKRQSQRKGFNVKT